MGLSKVEWLNERKKGIGGSDVAAICGLSPYKTPYQVWQEKRGLVTGEIPDNDAMFWGRTLEPVVRQHYSDVTGRSVRVPETILKHKDFDWMVGNIDGFTDDNRGVEIKTTSYPTGWGEPGTDEIPIGYLLQCQYYMIITAFPVFDVPVLIGGRDFRIYEVPTDKELQDMIIEQAAFFWKMVENGTPPEPRSYEDVIRRYSQSRPALVTASEQTERLIQELRGVREKLEAYELAEENLKTKILMEMKEADTLIKIDGSILATWKSGKAPLRLDSKLLQKELPKIYSKYAKEGEPSRRFLLKGGKDGK